NVSRNFKRNQGVLTLLNPVNGSWHVIWRQIAKPGVPASGSLDTGNRMLMVSSPDYGTTWTEPVALTNDAIPAFDLFEQGGPDSNILSFRGTAYPAGGFGADGKLYVAWTQLVEGKPKVVLATGTPLSSTSYGWTTPSVVSNGDDLQILPAVASGGGQLS